MADRINMRGGREVIIRARRLRTQSTDAERALWRMLRMRLLGCRFRRQYPIVPYIVDFACLEARLIADGSHHALPGDHDRRDSFLQKRGWRVLRFWNNDILLNPAGVYQVISEALAAQPPP